MAGPKKRVLRRCDSDWLEKRPPPELLHAQDEYVGLGDLVEYLLSSVGLTQAVYITIKKFLRLKPKCGCNKNKNRLNWVKLWRRKTKPAN